MIFDLFSSNVEEMNKMITLIENHDEYSFAIFINDHETLEAIFDTLFTFLYEQYFLRCAFDIIYLFDYKT